MNLSKTIVALLVLSVAAFSACERDLDTEVPTAPPQLVVNSVFTHDSTWSIELSSSATSTNQPNFAPLSVAQLTLTADGEPVTDLVLDSAYVTRSIQGIDRLFKVYQFNALNSMPRQNESYEVQVIHPNYSPVSASGRLPSPVMVEKTQPSQTGSEIRDINGREMRLYEFSIQSPSEGQFFGIEIINVSQNGDSQEKLDFFSTDDVFAGNYPHGNPNGKQEGQSSTDDVEESEGTFNDGAIYDTNNGIFFSNESFSGQSKTFSIYVDTEYGGSSSDLFLKILTLSPDLYDFANRSSSNTSFSLSQSNEVVTNVDGGYGIFAGYSTSTLSLD